MFVVDPAHKPIGTCALSWILRTPRWVPVADVMAREQTLIPVDMDQEEVALRFQKYALISAAVVDGSGRLVGMITVDDIVHIIQEEAGEDTLLLSGAGDGDINEPIRYTVRTRLTWLVINLGATMISASVVGLFQGEIARYALLAVLMPIVSAMGGNAGTQTLAVMVRALATNQLTSSNTVRMLGREFRVAACNGAALGSIGALGTFVIFGDPRLSAVFAAAMVINSLVAGLIGVVVPVALDKANIDPAVSSAVFVTTVTDVDGLPVVSRPRRARADGLTAADRAPTSRAMLHLTKVAFGATSAEHLAERLRARAEAGRAVPDDPLPAQAARGGRRARARSSGSSSTSSSPARRSCASARRRAAASRSTSTPTCVLVQARPKRAHQGWRYLEAADAPVDLGGDARRDRGAAAGADGQLAELALI